MKRIVLFALSAILLLSGCDNPSGPGSNTDDGIHSLKSMDIRNASTLFIASSNNSSRMSGRSEEDLPKKIFKITSEGYTQEVTYKDETGKDFSVSESPISIHNIDDSFIVVIFGYDSINPRNAYLVRKSDGAAFDLGSSLPSPLPNTYRNDELIKSDGAGNLYYPYWADGFSSQVDYIRKVDITNPDNLISSRYTPDTDSVKSFSVDNDGNVIYCGSLISDSMVSANRVKKNNGGLYDISSNWIAHWKGLNGRLFYTAAESANYEIMQVRIDSSFNVSTSKYGVLKYISSSMGTAYIMNLSDRIAIFDINHKDKIFEVDNETSTPQKITLSGDTFSTISAVDYSDSHYYIAGSVSGGSTIEKVNPSDGVMNPLLKVGEYSVYSMTVSSKNIITFNALRMSDGKKILGSVDAAGSGPYKVNIIDENLDEEVTSLERVL